MLYVIQIECKTGEKKHVFYIPCVTYSNKTDGWGRKVKKKLHLPLNKDDTVLQI